MNARALKIGVASQNARRCFIVSLIILLLLTFCIHNARATAVTRTDTNKRFLHQAPASGDKTIVRNSSADSGTDKFAMTPANDFWCHHRIRTRGRFAGNFQKDFTVTRDGHIPRHSSGIIVDEQWAAPSVIFLNTATARGPPCSGDQSLYLSDNALNHPAPHFLHRLASLRVSLSPFLVIPQHDSPAHLVIAGERGGCLACCRRFPIKNNQTAHLKELL